MSEAENKLRDARMEWEVARARWMDAQADIRIAKFNWEAAQTEFFEGVKPAVPTTTAMACVGCSGCPA
jgi:hypothetical protein